MKRLSFMALLLIGLAVNAAVAHAQDVSAVIINGCSMVPLRYVSESFGASVSYNSSTQNIGISLNYQKVSMTTGSSAAMVAGRQVTLDAAPVIIAGVTYVPVRFVSVSLGMKVIWMAETRQVKIVSPKSGKTIVLPVKEKPQSPGHRVNGTPGHGGASPGHGGTPPGQAGNGHHGNAAGGRGHGKH